MHLVAPLDVHFPLLYVLLREHVADNPEYKVYISHGSIIHVIVPVLVLVKYDLPL